MADKFLNLTDLVAIKTWIEGKFTNVIETVKVNGTALTPDANKAVNVEASRIALVMGGVSVEEGDVYVQIKQPDLQDPSMLAVVIDQGNGTPETYAVPTKGYVDSNAGDENVIETVKVNNSALTPDANKAVNVVVPVRTSDLTNDSFPETGNTSANEVCFERLGDGRAITFTVDLTNANQTVISTIDDEDSASSITRTLANKSYVDSVVPTATSDLTNDSDFQTGTEVQTAIDDALADVTGIDFEVVQTLPATGVKGTIYLVSNSGSGQNIYDEYIWLDGDPTGRYEKIGTTAVDLSNYWTMTTGQSNTLVAATVAEVNAILEPSTP